MRNEAKRGSFRSTVLVYSYLFELELLLAVDAASFFEKENVAKRLSATNVRVHSIDVFYYKRRSKILCCIKRKKTVLKKPVYFNQNAYRLSQ